MHSRMTIEVASAAVREVRLTKVIKVIDNNRRLKFILQIIIPRGNSDTRRKIYIADYQGN